MESQENIKFAIAFCMFVIAIGSLVWKMATFNSKTKSELSELRGVVEEIKKTDARQDRAINRIDDKTTNIDKAVAVVSTHTTLIKDGLSDMGNKLDRLIDKLTNVNGNN